MQTVLFRLHDNARLWNDDEVKSHLVDKLKDSAADGKTTSRA